MEYKGLTDERNEWNSHLQAGRSLDIYVLKQYRLNRNSNLWRSTREVEKLCETILFLEGIRPMSEEYMVHCDKCQSDISTQTSENSFRIRLTEEPRQFSDIPMKNDRELNRFMNFCNLAHLKEWIEKL